MITDGRYMDELFFSSQAMERLAKLIRDEQEDSYLYANENTYIN